MTVAWKSRELRGRGKVSMSCRDVGGVIERSTVKEEERESCYRFALHPKMNDKYCKQLVTMYLQFYINENGDKVYTTKKESPLGAPTQSAHPGMARNQAGFLVLILTISIWEAVATFHPISDSHRSAALELFAPIDGSFGSLEETYEALRTFEILGIEKKPDISTTTCPLVVETLGLSSTTLKDLFYALRVSGILKCKINEEVFEAITSRFLAVLSDGSSLLDFYHSIGGLVSIKASKVDVFLGDADGVFHSIKALSQSDGRWRYSSNNPESSTFAAGLALETLAGVVSLATSQIDPSMLPGDKMLGLAKFFLGIGIPGNAKGPFQPNRLVIFLGKVSIPLILSFPAMVLSLAKKDLLKVRVNTVLGSNAPPLTVKLMQAFRLGSKDASIIESQELNFDPENVVHFLDALPKSIDIGNYMFVFEILLHDLEHKKVYATGGQIKVPIFVTGVIKIDTAEIAVLDSDLGIMEAQQKLDLAGESVVSLSANHLQKLRLSFQLTTPLGHSFRPHQAFLKLRHETNVEHIFVVASSGKQFEIILDFLGLVEKFYYLSGRYDIQLTVGDAVMENSFLKALGHIELDLPEPPEKATRPPPQPVDPYLRYGPKAEISHIFRAQEQQST
ncbi:hypothetical protein L1049_003773 [Liquidambar formosana]|uniref:Dolichyl-diphosphooligosaccharide--protein glycosyltransferase subunit 2 n=1 Tax=Liquidambar formosana TaxID=63359 RepID=A0AAP0WVF2_LIQFO